MPDDYNQRDASERHYEQMRELQKIRDDLSYELNFYYDAVPKGEDDERSERSVLRGRLAAIGNRLNDLIRKLY